jgi:hypothetical protein
MSRFSRKPIVNSASPSFDPFTQPSAKVEIGEYQAQSGNVFAAVSVADMLKASGIAAPHGVYFPATRQGEEAVMLIRNPPAAKQAKPNPASQAPVMAQPLATIAPEKMLAALLARMTPGEIATMAGQPALATELRTKAIRRKAS